MYSLVSEVEYKVGYVWLLTTKVQTSTAVNHADSPEWVGSGLLQCNMRGSAIWELILITQEADFQMG